jgi:transposase
MKDINLTMEEQKRIAVIGKVFRGELTMSKAAEVLAVSERQTYRIKARIRSKGASGAAHGNRGRECPWKEKKEVCEKVVKLYRAKYRGFNDTHFNEKLKEMEGVNLSREKVRQILRRAGIATIRQRRGRKYRSRRNRKELYGMMLQVDGSPHNWLEGRGDRLCLVGAIDDATSKVLAAFFEEVETSAAYFNLFEAIFRREGLPMSVYADRHSIFYTDREMTIEEQLANKRPVTQVGRALRDLGVTLIPAGSPQAKGRIERLWGTFQDRLVSELRLAGARNKYEAQQVLNRYLPEYNRRFSIPAKQTDSAWRSLPETVNLKQTLCFKMTRFVANDNTISIKNEILQIPKGSPARSFARKKVDINVFPDGSLEIYLLNTRIARFENMKIQMEDVA